MALNNLERLGHSWPMRAAESIVAHSNVSHQRRLRQQAARLMQEQNIQALSGKVAQLSAELQWWHDWWWQQQRQWHGQRQQLPPHQQQQHQQQCVPLCTPHSSVVPAQLVDAVTRNSLQCKNTCC